ncbi:hypothetical protein B7486_58155 [cyanobacterium TDX16]|nr:hypothetical protein B7486_58155 [cyanobacterium TDX16]
MQGRYLPLAGDVDGDGDEDVVWYAAGPAADSIWTFDRHGNHTPVPIRVDGSYRPSIGDHDGDGTADLYWGRANGAGYLWSFVVGPRPTYVVSSVP